jgi:hypothetical protein
VRQFRLPSKNNLQASASKQIVIKYQDLSKQLAIALHSEEARCGYLSIQAHIMNKCHEECAQQPEGKTLCLVQNF